MLHHAFDFSNSVDKITKVGNVNIQGILPQIFSKVGAAEEAYRYGWPVFFYPLRASLGLILLGLGIGKKLSEFSATTVAQIFEIVYRSPALKRVASCLSILSLFMILVAQIIASQKFLVSLGFISTPFSSYFGPSSFFTPLKGG